MGSVDVCSNSTMMELPATCAHCTQPFEEYEDYDYDEGGEPATRCEPCKLEFHIDCLKLHACPKAVKADAAKLRDWELACADGRNDG